MQENDLFCYYGHLSLSIGEFFCAETALKFCKKCAENKPKILKCQRIPFISKI